jgi:hypothetical protein
MFCFEGDVVCTFDDVVTMTVPYDGLSGFTGCVPGRPLLAWLRQTKTPSIKWTATEVSVTVSASKSRLTMALLPIDKALYDIPNVKMIADEGGSFLYGLRMAAIALGTDRDHGWRLGVTVTPDRILSTDNICCVDASVDTPAKEAVILPPGFVTSVVGDDAVPPTWEIREGRCSAGFADGRVIMSRTLPGAQVRTHTETFDSFDWETLAPVTGELADTVKDLASFVGKEDPLISITYAKGALTLTAGGPASESSREVSFTQPGGSVAVKVAPKHLLKMLSLASRMRLTEFGIQISGKHGEALVAVGA